MGYWKKQSLVYLFLLLVSPLVFAAKDLDEVRREIKKIENDILESQSSQRSSKDQLLKIRKLISLQKREVEFSKSKISELSKALEELSQQRSETLSRVDEIKTGVRRKLIELSRIAQHDSLDASFLKTQDLDLQKSYYLSRVVKKHLISIQTLKAKVEESSQLESKILAEREKLESSLSELNDQNKMLSMNEHLQKELLKSNKTFVLETIKKVRSLKDSEKQLSSLITNMKKQNDKSNGDFLSIKGSLSYPVVAPILSGFGKSYDPKKHLLTFQKGVLFGGKNQSDVKCVADGVAVFVGPLNNYGNLVILEHNGGFYTLYGQLGDTLVKQGRLIKEGSVLGKTSSEPLYFEIRNREIAVDPKPWFASNQVQHSIDGNQEILNVKSM